MKSISSKLLVAFLAIVVSWGCQKDHGNYVYEALKIQESSAVRGVTAEVGTALQLYPHIDWADGLQDTLGFGYEWKLFDNLIGTERELTFIPPKVGSYPLVLYITDTETGHVTRILYRISATTVYQDGWLILSKDAQGFSKIHLIKATRTVENSNVVYRFNEYKNIYETNFQKPLGKNPIGIVSAIFPANDRDEILVLQSGGESVFLNGADFSERALLSNYLPDHVKQSQANPIAFFDLNDANQVFMDNGEVYWKMNSVQLDGSHEGMFYRDPLFFTNGARITSITNKLFYNLSNFHLVYDEKNARLLSFMANSRFSGTKLDITYPAPPPSNFTDVTNLNGFEHKYIGDYGTGNNFVHIIKENASGTYYIQNFATRAAERKYLQLSQMTQEPFAGSAYVNDATVYHRMKKTSYLLFATGSKFYFYDVNTRLTKLYHDFGSGNIVKLMTNDLGNQIGVGISDGRFAICDMNQSTLTKQHPGSEGGILFETSDLDAIIDFNWKWGTKTNFTNRNL